MDSSLLKTKLRVPPQTHHVLHRARLVDALERGILDHKLVLVAAPAGYGKTTLLSQWARASRVRVVWLSVGVEDNDPERFFRCLLAAWEEVEPGVAESRLGVLLGAMSPDLEAVLTAFLNVADDVRDHTVFILDDHDLIEDPSIHAALTFLIDGMPPTLHFVLAGRAEPALPLARYRARRQMLEFGAGDLHFSVEETGDFLNRLMGLELTPEAIAPLHARLEGWIAGLQLVSLTLRRRRDAVDALVVGGRHPFIADYLSEEVLAHLPEDSRWFLLRTSILDRLSAPLCDAVTGQPDGSQEMLERLEREHLFLVPLDDRREWFRYHRLFADVLSEGLRRRHPDELARVHRRAAAWHLAHDLPGPALRHAIAGDDPELAVRVFERHWTVKLLGGEYSDLAGWLDSLPTAWSAVHQVFSLARAGLLAFTGELDACVRQVDEIERRLAPAHSEESRWQLARVAAFRCFVACFQNDLARAELFADRALQNLRDEDLSFRADIYHALGDTYRGHGQWEQARTHYLKVLDLAHAPAGRLRSAHVFGALADLDLRRGRLRDAATSWRKALAAFQDRETWGRLPLPVMGWVDLRLGEVLYEWNELADAWNHLSRGLERAELGGDVRALIAGYLMAGRLKLTEGDIEAAGDYLERARPLVEQAQFPYWTSRFERYQLDLWLAQGRLRLAVDWADAMLRSGALEGRPESETARLALARVLLVKGDPPSREHALVLLEHLRRVAEAEDRTGVRIECLALRALAHWQSGDRTRALTSLEHAMRQAEPDGYARLFVDFGLPMARLLQEARVRGVMPDYVATLLAAYGAGLAAPGSREDLPPEPLSPREREVLQLIAAGLTNREIADTLVIAPETVKKHTGSIYGKLGVRRRTEAVARARALDLLD